MRFLVAKRSEEALESSNGPCLRDRVVIIYLFLQVLLHTGETERLHIYVIYRNEIEMKHIQCVYILASIVSQKDMTQHELGSRICPRWREVYLINLYRITGDKQKNS